MAFLEAMTLNPADPAFADKIVSELGRDILREASPRYLEEPRGRWSGQAGVLALPKTTDDVARLVKLARDNRVGVVPYGGGTGLVGGQVLQDGAAPLIVSLERMNALRAVWPEENVIIVEAGMILADVQRAATEAGRLFPLSLAAEGSARIGGNLATNAGGTGVLRYGNTRDLCLGLEAVLPDGQVWNGLSRLRKDNTGYDLRHLLIGAEGTLGIITAASLKLSPCPTQTGTAMMVVRDPASALGLLSLVRAEVGEGVSAFELIHRQGLDFLAETLPQIRQPFDVAPEWCALIELGVSASALVDQIFSGLFEKAVAAGLVSDGVIAGSQAQSAELWAVREQIPEANRLIGSVSSHDISVPLGALPDFIRAAGEAVAQVGAFRINCFGHVGDGNLHYNVFPVAGKSRQDHLDERTRIKTVIHDLVHSFDGSVSAEHGVGRLKVVDLETYGDPVKLAAMRAIKSALDPEGIMNPGAVLRSAGAPGGSV